MIDAFETFRQTTREIAATRERQLTEAIAELKRIRSEVERLVCIVVLAGEMRKAQRAYFKDRSQEHLATSKARERELDRALAELENPRLV